MKRTGEKIDGTTNESVNMETGFIYQIGAFLKNYG